MFMSKGTEDEAQFVGSLMTLVTIVIGAFLIEETTE
tara:strand:- start:235 stop:342 length:108 start_codon:yes stop_codon:yes gene_type:complete